MRREKDLQDLENKYYLGKSSHTLYYVRNLEIGEQYLSENLVFNHRNFATIVPRTVCHFLFLNHHTFEEKLKLPETIRLKAFYR